MPISFSTIPQGLLIPGFFVEMDASRAAYGSPPQRALLIGQTVTAADAVPAFCTTADAAAAAYGAGSMLARMVAAYRANDPFGEVWVLPVADNGSGVDATGTITVTGPATAAGTIALYIGGQRVAVGVASGDAQNTVAAAIAAAVNALTTLPVTASASTNVVTLAARNAGTLGNAIDIRHSWRGAQGGEALPAGIGLAIVAMASGATDPVMPDFNAVLGDIEYDFICAAWPGATPLAAYATLMADTTGRWSWLRQTYGHVFTAKTDTAANLLTLGGGRNDPHVTIIGVHDTPTWSPELAAATMAVAAVALRADPARPVQNLSVAGVLAPPPASRFSKSTRNSLLGTGIACLDWGYDGTPYISRLVTTYQKNPQQFTDRSLLDTETLFTYMAITRRLLARVASVFGRSKLARDGTRFGPGQPVATPGLIKAELVAHYATLEADGLVEDAEGFAANTIVEIDANDPNRVNVLYAPNLVNQLRVLAILNQFRI